MPQMTSPSSSPIVPLDNSSPIVLSGQEECTVLYEKKGRRYQPYANLTDWEWYGKSVMRVGEFRLVHCCDKGHYRYYYGVRPDNAAFLAACAIAQFAMEKAIMAKASLSPSSRTGIKYSAEQEAIIQRFKNEMIASGELVPEYWSHGSPEEIARAGIDAVKKAFEQSQEQAQ